MKIRIFRNLSARIIICLLAPAIAEAQSGSGDNFVYSVNPNDATTITVTNYTGSATVVTIPSTINGLTVTGVGDGTNNVFSSIVLNALTIPDTVLVINSYACYNNGSLTNLTLGTNIIGIGSNSFYLCGSLAAVTIPNSVLTIEAFAFEYDSMTNLVLGTNLNYIGPYAFFSCGNVESVTIPDSVTNLEKYAFAYCGMTNLHLGTNLTEIAPYAFYGCSQYPSLVLPNTVQDVETDAFSYGGMTNIQFSTNITNLASHAFFDCGNLETLDIPAGISTIADHAFSYCGNITNLQIGTNITSIDSNAFFDALNLPSLTLPGSVTNIGYQAFAYASIGIILLTNDPLAIGDEAFFASTVTNAIIDSGTIGDSVFEFCSFTNVTLGDNVTGIGSNFCQYCGNLISANIGNGIPAIPNMAFYECQALSDVRLGSNVTSIGVNAFAIDGNLPGIALPARVTNIGSNAFYQCTILTDVVFPTGSFLVGSEAFSQTGLLNVDIPNGNVSIGAMAFYQCAGLTNVFIGNNGTANIGNEGFADCSALATVTLGNATFGQNVFYGDPDLASVHFLADAPASDSSLFAGAGNSNLTVNFYAGTSGWTGNLAGAPTFVLPPNSISVVMGPNGAVAAGAQWELDSNGVAETNSFTTLLNIPPGPHTISFAPVSGWNTPSNQVFTMTNGAFATLLGVYTSANSASNSLVLQTNGDGAIHHAAWPAVLVIGKKYSITAEPAPGNVFAFWSASTNGASSVLSTSPACTFTMESNLVLTANFMTNPFTIAMGTYNGIFSATNGVSVESSGMLKNLIVRENGSYSGSLLLGGASHAISGKFNFSGQATNIIKRPATQGGNLAVELILDQNDDPAEVIGLIYGSNDVAWSAILTAYLATNNLSPAEYTVLIGPDTNNEPPTLSPGGDGYAVITNDRAGVAKITGALADGSVLSETAPVSEGSFFPIYASLYQNKGLLFGWISLDATNSSLNSLTWIHPAASRGLYTSGFTNILAPDDISLAVWSNPPVGVESLSNLTFVNTVTNTNGLTNVAITTSSSGQITGPAVTGSINLKTGGFKVVYGSGESKITAYGAVSIGTNGAVTNAAGYYLTATNAQAVELNP